MLEVASALQVIEFLGPLLPGTSWIRRDTRKPLHRAASHGRAEIRSFCEAASAGEVNPLLVPWALFPAIDHLEGDRVAVKLVGTREQPLGILPLSIGTLGPFRLPATASVWAHRHCFDTTPPVRAGHERQYLEALFAGLSARGVKLLHWPRLSLGTDFSKALDDYLDERGLARHMIRMDQRPLLLTDASRSAELPNGTVSRKRLRELNRCRRRLDELGTVTFRTYSAPHDANLWSSDFLALEASGWKGAAGTATALACNAADRAYFEIIARETARRGAALVYSLELDGRPLAMTVNFRDGRSVWAFKTAYDDAYAHLSVGVLVEMEGTRAALADRGIAAIDSCADGDGGLMGELWPDRRPFGDLLIAISPVGNLCIQPASALLRSYRWVRSRAGRLVSAVKRHRSRSARNPRG